MVSKFNLRFLDQRFSKFLFLGPPGTLKNFWGPLGASVPVGDSYQDLPCEKLKLRNFKNNYSFKNGNSKPHVNTDDIFLIRKITFSQTN